MLIEIETFLSAEEVGRLLDLVRDGTFEDGRRTAGAELGAAKINEQLRVGGRESQVIGGILLPAMDRNQDFQSFAWPHRVHLPRLSRYRPGMAYGRHIDNPVMGGRDPIRTDLSLTVFLSEPESYDGGELSLDTPFGEKRVKMGAGGAVVYATTLLHQVLPVTHGERIALVTWIQSLVKQAERRGILHDIAKAREALKLESVADEATGRLLKTQTNLLKMWAEV